MKKILLTSAVAIAACFFAFTCSARDTVIKVKDLPKTAQTFLATHFSGIEVAVAIKDGHEYEIRLENGWELDIDHKGQWETIDCNRDEVPASVMATIPKEIVSYLKSNFEKAYVTEISKDLSGYDVELSNGLDVEFYPNGRFKRIDD